jgi:hypothetical protein
MPCFKIRIGWGGAGGGVGMLDILSLYEGKSQKKMGNSKLIFPSFFSFIFISLLFLFYFYFSPFSLLFLFLSFFSFFSSSCRVPCFTHHTPILSIFLSSQFFHIFSFLFSFLPFTSFLPSFSLFSMLIYRPPSSVFPVLPFLLPHFL